MSAANAVPGSPPSVAIALSLLPSVALSLVVIGCASMRPQPFTLSAEQRSEVEGLAQRLVAGAESDREKALRIYRFVRDEIEYGFTGRFDDADPFFTLAVGRGHCNPQTELMVALLRATGLEARQRFVTIEADILRGLFPKQARPPTELNHSFTEVKIEGRWLRVDGYAVDRELWLGARSALAERGWVAGFGAHRESCNEWDGRGDCMGQFVDPAWQRRLWDPLEPARSFYSSDGYTQKMGPIVGLLYRSFGVRSMNSKLQRLRARGRGLE